MSTVLHHVLKVFLNSELLLMQGCEIPLLHKQGTVGWVPEVDYAAEVYFALLKVVLKHFPSRFTQNKSVISRNT